MIRREITKSSYKPNLEEFISQCEINYYLILQLIPWLNQKRYERQPESCDEQLEFRPKSGHKIDSTLVEKAKYTTTMMLRLHSPFKSNESETNLMVRLYHDAQLLEVMDKAGPRALKAVNKGEHLLTQQADEKRQLNRFLGESLRYCLMG